MLLKQLAVSDILNDRQHRISSREIHRAPEYLDIDDPAVLGQMRPMAGLTVTPWLQLAKVIPKSPRLAGWAQVGRGHCQKLLARISVFRHRSLVHLQELQCLDVEDPHWHGMIGKQVLEIFGVLPQGLLGLFAGRDVAGDSENAGRRSRSFQKRAAHFEIDRPVIFCQNLYLVMSGRIAIPLPGKRRVARPQVLRRKEIGALRAIPAGCIL